MALHKTGRTAVQNGVDNLTDFKQSAISGKRYGSWADAPKGRLDAFELAEYAGRHKRAGLYEDEPVYVVYSYATPIAWTFDVHESPRQRRWIQNETNYSVTTTHHQNVVAVAIDNPSLYSS